MAAELRRTGLFDWHRSHDARLGEFAGFEMPLYYSSGAVAEHRMVRESVGLFDIAHMGRFIVGGPDAISFLEHVITSSIPSIPRNSSRYGLLCRDDGCVLDDVFVYRVSATGDSSWLRRSAETTKRSGEDIWLVVVNAGNRKRDYDWLVSRGSPGGFDIEVHDVSEDVYMIAVQGPAAVELVGSLSDRPVDEISRFAAGTRKVVDTACLLGRTGYTGEDGVELYFPADRAVDVWDGIIHRARERDIPCGAIGLAARDSLRFEPGFALYGHELDESTTPVEAGLKWACDFSKPFIGRDPIRRELSEGLRKRLVTLQMIEPGVPRQGFPVIEPDGRNEVGLVVSGMFAPTADGYFANAFVSPAEAATGTELAVDIRGRARRATIVKRPIYTPAYR